jgi:hypothetical protein
MKFSLKGLSYAAALASLTLSVAACSGGASPNGTAYVPSGAANVSQPASGGAASPDRHMRIDSTCGRRIHIVVAGLVDCRFHERGYGDGKFTIHDHTKGIVLISALEGTRKTRFTITGAVVGRGFFLVRDTRGNYLVVRVRVTL